jgi:ABC-type nitrate/sulfonate/bicarbonate transport system substrate-binding protein
MMTQVIGRSARRSVRWSAIQGLFMVIVLAVVLSACQPMTVAPAAGADATPEAALTPVSIGVGYIPNVQFATFYVAIEKGFYAEEGLDVSLEYGFENDYLKLVGVGERQFMVGSGDQVIIGIASALYHELVYALSRGGFCQRISWYYTTS